MKTELFTSDFWGDNPARQVQRPNDGIQRQYASNVVLSMKNEGFATSKENAEHLCLNFGLWMRARAFVLELNIRKKNGE